MLTSIFIFFITAQPQIITRSEEIPCGLLVVSGVDDNGDGILTEDEIIAKVIICDKDKGKLQKPIIRTQGI